MKGSALAAATGGDPKLGKDAILALMDAVEKNIPTPKRETEKPFLMPVEDTFSISGRGTVVTGRIEQGVLKVGDDLEIVGLVATQKSTCTGKARFSFHLPTYPHTPYFYLQRNLRFCNRALFVVILIVLGIFTADAFPCSRFFNRCSLPQALQHLLLMHASSQLTLPPLVSRRSGNVQEVNGFRPGRR